MRFTVSTQQPHSCLEGWLIASPSIPHLPIKVYPKKVSFTRGSKKIGEEGQDGENHNAHLGYRTVKIKRRMGWE